ncbi:MAG: BrnA antitoxin family protein [Allosphingosinicella sp.]
MSDKSQSSIDHDPDDAPPFTREMAARAQLSIGDTIIREADPPLGRRRGRPAKPEADRKELVSLRLSPDVLAWLRATGPGWQTRVDDLLRVKMAARHTDE